MLIPHYQIKTPEAFKEYLSVYIPLVLNVAQTYDVQLDNEEYKCDHIGFQVLSKEEFDAVSEILSTYSRLIHNNIIHERRNRVYEFNDPLTVGGMNVPRIEIFEPKPSADIGKLKAGVEHIAFFAENYDELFERFQSEKLPIDKHAAFEDGSKFFKTTLINMVEIEFRNDFLGVSQNQ